MRATVLCPELVAPVASMLAAAWAAGPTGPAEVVVTEVRARPESTGAPVPGSGEAGGDEGREQGDGGAPVPGGGDLPAPVDAGTGTGSRRVDRAAVCPRGGSGPAGLGGGAIEVIDTDLGISGRSTEGRDGFKGLVARVRLGEVGAIFGLEVSRLSRSSADLSRLLELARLTDTLVIDADGIYDLAEFNDRLLLGLKGTMSEALSRYRDKASYGDLQIMPTRPRNPLP